MAKHLSDDASVGVIIVNYNTADLACRTLDSLASERGLLPNLQVLVIDNQSPDCGIEILEAHILEKDYGGWAKAILATRNGGYAYGNNIGLDYFEAHLKPDYYWLLNPDTYLRPGAGLQLVAHLSDTGPAIAGSRLEDADGGVQISAFNFPSPLSETLAGFGLGLLDRMFARYRTVRAIPEQKESVSWVAGASLMIPRAVFKQVGRMDESYFLYFEEVDYCLQVHRAGFACWYVPESRVVHEVGASTGISDTRKAQPRRPQYWFDSRRRYFLKNHGVMCLVLGDIGWILGYALWRLRKGMAKSDVLDKEPPYLLRDFLRNSTLNPAMWSKAG